MTPQIVELHVEIVRFLLHDQPPIVACEFVDADGRRHTFVDKVWIFTDRTLDVQSEYPQAGAVRCAASHEWHDSRGRQLVRISTAHPDFVESTEGLSEFVVLRDQVSAPSDCAPG